MFLEIKSIEKYKYGTLFFSYKEYFSEIDKEELKKIGFDDCISSKWKKEDVFKVIDKKIKKWDKKRRWERWR